MRTGVWQYQQYLPEISPENQVTMGEGDTPLIKSVHIGPESGLPNLYFKLENLHPTGSYKDRFAALAISGLLENNTPLCLATSSGNTGAALAAYSARAQIPCFIAVVDGAPKSKVAQMQVYGVNIFGVKAFGHDSRITEKVFDTLNRISTERGTQVQISAYKYSPLGMSGVETIAFEIADQLENPQHIFIPSGGGGLACAVANGFNKLAHRGKRGGAPRIHCVQPRGNDTIVSSIRENESRAKAIEGATTKISGLQVPNVIDGDQVVREVQKTGGTGQLVDDEEVFAMQELLTQKEGIYCEPAGAVAAAGALSAVKNGEINPEENMVCLVTGHGFKDEASANRITKNKKFMTLNTSDDIHQFIE